MADEQTPVKREVLTADFVDRYTNNVRFEGSLWDLRALFGVLDVESGNIRVHSAVNIAWPQAKLIAYYMQMHIAFHEAQQGPIRVPEHTIPAPIIDSAPGIDDFPGGKRVRELSDQLRALMFPDA